MRFNIVGGNAVATNSRGSSESTPGSQAPATTGVHHFSPTVSDVEASAEFYSPYSTVVFRDPDNIALELIHLPA